LESAAIVGLAILGAIIQQTSVGNQRDSSGKCTHCGDARRTYRSGYRVEH